MPFSAASPGSDSLASGPPAIPSARQRALFPLVLLALYLPFWIGSAFVAIDMRAWLADALMNIGLILLLALTFRRAQLSNASFFLLFLFLVFSQIGINHAYEHTPYNRWGQALLGIHIDSVFGWERNQYDRFIHLLFGLLTYLPLYEMARSLSGVHSRFWRHFFAFMMVNAMSAIYEVLELMAAWVIRAESYWLYLGMQGDVLDAPKDMGMALIGAALAMGLLLLWQWRSKGFKAFVGRVRATPAAVLLLASVAAAGFAAPAPQGSAGAPALAAAADSTPTASEILDRSLQRYDVPSAYSELRMQVVRPAWENEIRFRVWNMDDRYALVQVTAPARDRGQAFLKRENDLWHWIPSVERTVRMSSALLSQSWMGSDFSLGDVIRNTSLADDYDAALAGKGTLYETECYRLVLTPRQDAPVVWGSVHAYISTADYDQLRAEFYDPQGQLVQVLEAFDFRLWQGRRLPARLQMTPVARPGHRTVVFFERIDFRQELNEAFFSQQRMRRL